MDRPTLEQLLQREHDRRVPADTSVQRRRIAADIGVLCQTVIRSPMIKQIISARLRSDDKVQLLLIGENFIHIHELIDDEPQYILRLQHRRTLRFHQDHVRSVALIGRSESPQAQEDTALPSIYEAMAASDDSDAEPRPLPIRIIAVALHSGVLNLFALDEQADNQKSLPLKSKLIPLPTLEAHVLSHGAHIAVDPYSRAFAVPAAYDSIVIYNNYDSTNMNIRMASSKDWNPIRQEKIMKIPGRITAVEFLHPGRNVDLVVMIVVTTVDRQSRLSCFKWSHKQGPQYETVLENKALQLDPGSLCNLVIPMAHSSDFLVVHGTSINLYSNILQGVPTVSNIMNKKSNWENEPLYPASSRRRPLFTGWARPERLKRSREEYLYLIREDGVIRHYQLSRTQSGVGLMGNTGRFNCSVGSAIASFVPVLYKSNDFLIAAGDMNSGELLSVGYDQRGYAGGDPSRKDVECSLVRQAVLHDWTPICDIAISGLNTAHGSASLLTTAGRQPYGALCQLRMGYEAQIQGIVDPNEDNTINEPLVGANAMWTVHDSRRGATHFICSYPGHSVALCRSPDGSFGASKLQLQPSQDIIFSSLIENEGVVIVSEQCVSHQGFPNFAAGEMDIDAQVSDQPRNSTFYLAGPWFLSVVSTCSDKTQMIPVENRIVSAACTGAYLAIATQVHRGSSNLVLFKFNHEVQALASSGQLDLLPNELSEKDEITAMTACTILNSHFFVIATRDDHALHLFKVVNDRLIIQRHVELEQIVSHDIRVVSQYLADDANPKYYVFCGLRDGRIAVTSLIPDDDWPSTHDLPTRLVPGFSDVCYYKAGNGPVRLSSGEVKPSTVLAICDERVIALQLVKEIEASTFGIDFTSFHLVDDYDASFVPGPLVAISPWSDASNHGDGAVLACHDGERLIIAEAVWERRALPRRTPLRKYRTDPIKDEIARDLSGTPTKYLYSVKLDAAIVAGHRFDLRARTQVPEASWHGKRISRGFVTVIPATANAGLEGNDLNLNDDATHIDLAPSERVLSMCEVNFRVDGRSYHYLLLGTKIQEKELTVVDGKKQRPWKGRLWFLAPRRDANGTIRLELKSLKTNNQPVRALASLGETEVIVADSSLSIYSLAVNNKWTSICKIPLSSPAAHVTTNGSQIYVTTVQHSVFGYEVIRRTIEDKPSIELHELCKDDVGRDGITHLEVLLSNGSQTNPAITQSLQTATQSQQARDERALKILLASDKRGQMFGLEVPKYRSYQSTASTLFEMQLPQSVIKFVKGKVRMPWYERETPVRGVLNDDDIIGATTDGTIYHFTLLTNEARLLLKFLENLMRWNEIEDKIALLCPEDRTSDGKRAHSSEAEKILWPIQNVVIDPEFVPGAQGRRLRRDQYAIDGEWLVPLIEGGIGACVKTLSSIMQRNAREWPRDEESRYNGNQVDARVRKFLELIENALGGEDGSGEELYSFGLDTTMEKNAALAVVRCVRWVHEVMRPIL